jgi:hypothetical protein
MSIIQDISERYAEETHAFMELEARQFLERNGIKFTNLEKTNKLLRDKGYRLIDEVEDITGDRKHTLLLVRVIDQTSYIIKAPTLTYEQ